MSLGDTKDVWTAVDRLVDGSAPGEIYAGLIIAAFDALSLVLKRSDMALSSYPEPISEVALYQAILVNRVTSSIIV